MFPSLDNSLGLAVDQKTNQQVFKQVSEATTLTPHDTIVNVVGSSDPIILTLPPVAACAGRIFAITGISATATNTVTVAHAGDSANWTDVVLDAANESVLLFCDGRRFWTIALVG